LGVNAFRINLSHGDASAKREMFRLIKALRTNHGDRPSIIADLAGPKIRVTDVLPGFNIEPGQEIRISNEHPADENTIRVTSGFAFSKVNKGGKILINDGRIQMKVVDHSSPNTLLCETILGGVVANRKGVNFPGVELDLPPLTRQDETDLLLSLEEGADWLALSFVRSFADYHTLKPFFERAGKSLPVIAKIEKWEALEDLEAIVESFDAVMVARGDLGVEIPNEQVPLVQKRIIREANRRGKPVIIATQMLESMIEQPVPTRAEVSDIANAIFDGADALLVTGETAMGKYPRKVVKVLKQVILETEKTIDYWTVRPQAKEKLRVAEAISHATCEVAHDLNIPYIVTMTHSGSTARMLARYRPSARLLALTPFPEICRQLAFVWGVSPFLVRHYTKSDEIPERAKELLLSKKLLSKGDRYVITGGVPVGVPGTTNFLAVHEID